MTFLSTPTLLNPVDFVGGVVLDSVAYLDKSLILLGDAGMKAADTTGDLTLKFLNVPDKFNTRSARVIVGAGIIISGASTFILRDTGSITVRHIDPVALSIPEQPIATFMASPPPPPPEALPDTPTPSETLLRAIHSPHLLMGALTKDELEQLKKVVHYTGSTPFLTAFEGLAPGSQRKFFNLLVDYHTTTGKRANVKSAHRDFRKQRQLVRQYGRLTAAGACGSPHAIGALDIDRRGRVSLQVSEMEKLGLLKKHRLWVPPYVGEAWHVEDPDAVYFRYWSKEDPSRKIYERNVCKGMDGVEHTKQRYAGSVFTVKDSFERIQAEATSQLDARGIHGDKREVLMNYLLLSARAESIYGQNMLSVTGARGWWMFTVGTAAQYNLKCPMQLKEAMRATLDLAIDNSALLEKNNKPLTPENIYLSHMVGGRGHSLIHLAVDGNVLSEEDSATLTRVVSVNISAAIFKTIFYKDGGITKRQDGITDQMIAQTYMDFWAERLTIYKEDVRYMSLAV